MESSTLGGVVVVDVGLRRVLKQESEAVLCNR